MLRLLAKLVPRPLLAAVLAPGDPLLTKRSGKWARVRAEWLAVHGTCAACGGTDDLQVHHVRDFADNPDLELDPGNFITLCESPKRLCHIRVGHCWNWHTINEHSRSTAQTELYDRKHARPIIGAA
jgi:hypothetical protein